MKKNFFLFFLICVIIGGIVFTFIYFTKHKSLNINTATTTQSSAKDPISDQTVEELLSNYSDLSVFTGLLKKTNLDKLLSEKGPFTVFAPTNEAFSFLPSGSFTYLQQPQNGLILKQFLKYQIAQGNITTNLMSNKAHLISLNGQESVEIIDTNNYSILDAKGNKTLILKSNIRAKNGVIHIVGSVLLPQ
jgi:hypothetical protein